MESRRFEVMPAALIALAVGASGVAGLLWLTASRHEVAAAPQRYRPASNAPIDFASGEERQPDRSQRPIAARQDRLEDRPDIAYSNCFVRQSLNHLAAQPLRLAVPDASQLQVVRAAPAVPFPAEHETKQVVVLLPAEPAWRAGTAGRVIVDRSVRNAWAVAGWDTLGFARRAGRVLAQREWRVSAEWVTAGVRGADRWVRKYRERGPAKLAKPVARVSPRLAAPVYSDHQTPQLPIPLATVGDYLAAIGQSARPGYLGSTIAAQLDRVAKSPRTAPWAWAVAYRLRVLATTPDVSPAHERALHAIALAVTEAFSVADTHTLETDHATELRRAAYSLQRRVSTWQAEREHRIAMRAASPGAALVGARWAMAPVNDGDVYGALLDDSNVLHGPNSLARRLDEYERRPRSRLARTLAIDAARLAMNTSPSSQELATAIEHNYRNANVRVAIAADLLERLLPQPEPIVAAVRDRIAGTPVTGRSTTQTQIGVRLVPDDSAWRLGLEAEGVVSSRTRSRGGPAVLTSRAETQFSARKLIVVTSDGLQTAPAVADARTPNQRLTGLSTNYDRVPLVGAYVRSAARQEYGRLRTRVRAETRMKVQRQAGKTLDERVAPRLAEVEQRYEADVVRRAAALGLQIVPIEMRTTDKRLISRVRVANDTQLAAHTPRMRAPSDSLLSLQLHESMLNNALEGLGLAGATITPEELNKRLVEKLRLPGERDATTHKAVLRFAEEDPIRLRLEDGRAQLTLAIDEIAVRGRRHRDFRVHAFYRPEADGLAATLVQDGTPHIEGRLRTASRMHLHGVIGKVLGENRRIPLVRVNAATPERVATALEGLSTNQFVIEDGWLGLAIGPQRTGHAKVAVQIGSYVR